MRQMNLQRSDLLGVVVGGGIGGAELVRNATTKEGLELVLVEPNDRIECQALYPDYLGGRICSDSFSGFRKYSYTRDEPGGRLHRADRPKGSGWVRWTSTPSSGPT
jgi:folate-dependent tRNA-U54 methylase TrmFO/GidA